MQLKDMIKQFNALKRRYQGFRNRLKDKNYVATLRPDQKQALEQERDDLYAEVEELGQQINQKIKETSAS